MNRKTPQISVKNKLTCPKTGPLMISGTIPSGRQLLTSMHADEQLETKHFINQIILL